MSGFTSIEKITLVDGDDWNAIYINGEMFNQGDDIPLHSFGVIENLLTHLGIPHERLVSDYDWLYEQGHFPNKLSEVKLDDG